MWCCLLHKGGLTLKSEDDNSQLRDHSNETYRAVDPCGIVLDKGGSNFNVYG